MMQSVSPPMDVAIVWLLIGALFFVMRSCEYLKTCAKEGRKRTKILRLNSIKFRFKRKIFHHKSKYLTVVDIVMITFKLQKMTGKVKLYICSRLIIICSTQSKPG